MMGVMRVMGMTRAAQNGGSNLLAALINSSSFFTLHSSFFTPHLNGGRNALTSRPKCISSRTMLLLTLSNCGAA